jgi:thioesterase domain-containing protein
VGMKPQRNEQKKSMNKEIRKIEEKQWERMVKTEKDNWDNWNKADLPYPQLVRTQRGWLHLKNEKDNYLNND